MQQYLEVLRDVFENGVDRPDRTGVGTRAVFGRRMEFDMADGFPAVTTKELAFESVVAELLWFISGSSDNNKLHKLGCHIWDANAAAPYWKEKARFPGDLGRVYGVQWRHWQASNGKEVDQLANAIEEIKNNPYSRRIVVTAWNPGELDQMVLPPCHALFQFFVADGKLSLQLCQRSADMFLGVPFNIASYSLLLHMVAQVTGLEPGEFIHTLGDAHIYRNHFDVVRIQLSREPFSLPRLELNPEIKDIDGFTMKDIKLVNYNHYPALRAPMAV